MTVADDECLGINDFNEVYQESKHCSADWEEIGSLLGISKHTIAIIKEDNPQRCEHRLNAMLTHWLKKIDSHDNPSWKSLCQALYIVDRDTANQIAEKHHITNYIKLKDITKPILKWIDVISHYQPEVCKILEHSDESLLSLANNLFEKGIIDDMTKNEVDRQKGYDGADTMIEYVKMKIKQTPALCQTFLQVMEKLVVLEDVVEHIKNKSEAAIFMHSEDFDITNVESTVEDLQEMFDNIIFSTTEAIENVNVKYLKARISCFFNHKKESDLAIEDYLIKLESVTNPEGVLNFLVRNEFIGWMNYELIKVFQRVAKNKKLNDDINLYEQRHIHFLQVKFKDIVKLFRRRPDFAPKFPVGLPKLQIWLDKPWEDKSMYEWKEFLQKRFNWPPDLVIKTISKNCVILTYAVLPVFVLSVVRDLSDPHVLSELESEGVRVHFLFNLGRQDVASQTMSMPMESSEFLSSQHISEEEREKQNIASQMMSMPEKNFEKAKCLSTQHISSDSEEEKEKQDIVSQTMSTPENSSEITKFMSETSPIPTESSPPIPRETFQPQSVLTYQNAREAMITEVDIAYARIMLLGPAGVGKTSLVRGLKKLPFIRKSTSTQVADVRPVSYSWSTGDWKDVNKQDELDEVANLLATVHHDLQSAEQLIISSISRVESVRVLYEGNSSVPSSEIEEGQVKEVETTKVESYLKDAIRRAKQLTPYGGVRDLKPSLFFHVWDCGGQPVLLEILPAFLTPRTMFLLLFDASKDFKETWKSIQYEEGTGIPGEESNMTIIELLDRWMATIHSHLSGKTKQGGLVDYPRILGIGTYGDLLNEEEKLKVIEQFQTYCENKAFSELLDHEVFIVDNSSAQTDSGFSKLHKIIQRFATENLVVKTPVSWVLFRKVLQMFSDESRNVISFNEAKAIGIACKIEAEDIHKVLMFYHDLGVILFYPHIKSFEHRVILNPKWFVESLGKVITLPGREIQKTSKKMWKTLRKKGILIQPLYVAVWKECKDIDPEGMMELLTHLRLAAKVQAEEYYDTDTPQYFVPAVLPLFCGDLSTPTTAGSLRATPLHITFSTKFVTPGYFTRLVTTIASFEVCKLYFEEGIYRNRVVFEFTPDDKQYNFVTLTELSYAIQVDKTCESLDNQKSPFSKSCQDLLVLLKRSCEEVDECFYQGYPSNITQSTKGYRDKFRFLCISDKCKTAENIHYLNKTRESQTCCQLRKQFRDLEEEESYWFPQVLQSAKSNTISEKEIVEISRQIGECGAELAALLGRKAQWVNIIQDPRKASNPIFNLLLDWNQQVGGRDELVKHLRTLNLLKLANQIEADHNECDMDSYRSDTLLRKRRLSSNPPQQPLEESTAHQPTPKCSQSAPHLIQVHHQKKHSSPMKQVPEEMESEDKFQDSTSVSKFIDLLLENEKFVQKLKTIQLAEKRAGDESNGGATSLDGFENDDSWSARSRSTNSRPESSPVNSHSEILPHSLPVIQPPDVDNIPHTDIVRCCNFITCDINYLAAVMDLPEDEISAIARSTSDVQAQILRIVKKWISKNPNKQKEDLNVLLMSAKLEDAARSLMDPNYNVEEPTQPSKRCNIL